MGYTKIFTQRSLPFMPFVWIILLSLAESADYADTPLLGRPHPKCLSRRAISRYKINIPFPPCQFFNTDARFIYSRKWWR